MTMVFGIGATLSAVSADAARGVTDRFRSLPMAAPAVIAGRAAADMLNSAAALAVLTGCGFAAGWHPHRGAARAIAALGLLLLLRFAFLWIGVYLGLRFYSSPEAVTAVRTLEFPIGFLGNPFVAVSTMPAWLGAHRTVEPAVVHRHRRPPALRRPHRRELILDHQPRDPHGGRLAAAADRRLLPAVPAPLPAPRPVTPTCFFPAARQLGWLPQADQGKPGAQ